MAKLKKSSSSSSSESSDVSEVEVKPAPPKKKTSKPSAVREEAQNYLEANFPGFEWENNQNNTKFQIGEDEEVFLLQIPKSIKPDSLLGKKVNFKKRTKFEENGQNYEIRLLPGEQKQQSCMTTNRGGKTELSVFDLQGVFVVQESVEDENNYDKLGEFLTKFEEEQESPIETPRNLKVRHPLLGSEYEKELADRQGSLIKLVPVKTEKKSENSPEKKKKKRKAQEAFEEDSPAKSSPSKKKVKKENHEVSSDLQWLQNI